jgi:hypothetical protein
MFRTITSGFVTVVSVAGAIAATFLVLFLVGTFNQHTKGMAAVGDGLVDVIKWFGLLAGKGFRALGL